MFSLKSALLGLMTVVISGAAWSAASDPQVSAVVEAVPDEVTLQRNGLGPLAAYKVTLTNNATNTLNRVKFEGTAQLTTGSLSASIAIDSVVVASTQDPNCVVSSSNVVTCTVGSLAPQGSVLFYAVVKSPLSGDNITLNWTFNGAEGNSLTGQGCCTKTGLASTLLTDALSTSGKTKAKSFVAPLTGLTLFTGASSGAVDVIGSPATRSDPYTTTVVIPMGVTTTAAIEETEALALPCQVGACYKSQLTIPGAFTPRLTIFLRRDGTTTVGNIRNAVIYYTADTVGAVPIQLVGCDLTDPPGPATHLPCIKSRLEYTRSNSPSPVDDWVNDWQFEIWASDNGKYTQ